MPFYSQEIFIHNKRNHLNILDYDNYQLNIDYKLLFVSLKMIKNQIQYEKWMIGWRYYGTNTFNQYLSVITN